MARPSGSLARVALAAVLATGLATTADASSARAVGVLVARTPSGSGFPVPLLDPQASTPISSRGSRVPGLAAALTRWTGGVDLYRRGTFSTQGTWRWCTAAGVQIMRNIARGQDDHSWAAQRRYFRWMRRHDRYDIPVRDGTDPAGWAAGLRRWVDPSYRVVASGSFRRALRSAVTRLRRTNLPVGITVAHGNHAWVLTGFSATADPAKTSRFRITSVRVTGPLWGLQNRSFGYDMRPNRRLRPSQLRRFFTPWHYARVRMSWEGRWVSVQPGVG